MDHEAHSRTNFVNMKPQRVKVEDSFDPALEDESETIEHLLAEPKSEYVTVDGVLCFDKENAGQCLNMGDFSCGYDFGLNTCSGGFLSAHPQGRHNELELGNNSIDKAVTHGFHGNFRRKKRRRTPVAYPASIILQNLDELDIDEKPSVSGMVSAAFLKEKRPRKPTRRYIEEFSDKMSKDSKGREDCSAVTAIESRRSKVRSQNKHHHLRPRTLALVTGDDLISENQTLAEFRKQRARRKKYASISMLECDESDESYESNEQLLTSESEDDYVISQYGVGQWTDIKRLLFASSPYCTPLDLRVEQKEMSALPKSLVPRVCELATVHPYPRRRGNFFAPPILPIASTSASSDHIRRYVRRKKNRF
ncbi:hypothetical protein C1H46_001189 [Malus baccata]|uniref:Uncharacterized protein n=1 Tax=Malus baccata TaxID=106549 RepID=A0A540NQ02_MALBA|nr:hypothetical protein C1H46_001189 [Malus baccata]